MNWTRTLGGFIGFLILLSVACAGEESVVDMSKVDCRNVRQADGSVELVCR